MSKLRVFEVPPATKENLRPEPVEHPEPITIAGDGDAAKRAARVLLEGQGYVVRSMNWGPDSNPAKPPVLIAYVAKKES